MRKAINENPVVQLSLLGGLLVVVGLLLVTQVIKKDEPADEPSPGAAALPADVTGAAGAPASPAGSAAPPIVSSSSGTPPTGSVSPEALIPGPGLPSEVVDAWSAGDAIVLLIVRNKGIDDRLVRSSVAALNGDSRVSVFVAPVKDVADYSRITQSVGVSRVPALVVVRPRGVTGEVPQAEVQYGFRTSQGVVQAVEDALYEGRDDVPYHPG